jgi:hypothetical protein
MDLFETRMKISDSEEVMMNQLVKILDCRGLLEQVNETELTDNQLAIKSALMEEYNSITEICNNSGVHLMGEVYATSDTTDSASSSSDLYMNSIHLDIPEP